MKRLMKSINDSFEQQMTVYWFNLSRVTNLLIILNISLFFLTELVTKQGYYYTYYSLLFLLIVEIGLIMPLGLLNRLWYYCIFLIFEFLGFYFLSQASGFGSQGIKLSCSRSHPVLPAIGRIQNQLLVCEFLQIPSNFFNFRTDTN